MHNKFAMFLLFLCLLVLPIEIMAQGNTIGNQVRLSTDQLPLTFEPNRGQTDASVRFLSHGSSYAVFLGNTQAVLLIPGSSAHDVRQVEPSLVKLDFLDASPGVQGEGVDQLPGKSNYFIGSDHKTWLSGIPQFRKVRFKSVYPGIDLVYYGGESGLEYDFVMAPGADAARLRFRVTGVDKIALNNLGDLSLRVADHTITLHRPSIYQEENGQRKAISGGFTLRGGDEVGLTVGNYDHSRTLVIDPVLVYSTLIGANNSTQIQGVAVGPKGDVFITGSTFATNYPTVNAFQSTNKGYQDVFITKLNAAGNTILYSTYIGSSGFDNAAGIAVDSAGNAYITGTVGGADFPTTPGAFMTTCPSLCNTPFVSKFLADGNLEFSTFMGGSNSPATAIAVDNAGEAYITGDIVSNDMATTSAAFQATCPGACGFIEKLNASGTGLVYSTYFGAVVGGGSTTGRAIAVDSPGSAYLVGNTTGIPIKNALQPSVIGGPNAFVTKFTPDGSSLVFSTYLGGTSPYFFGSAGDFATGVAVDQFGNIHVVGTSSSCEFPLTMSAWSTDCANQEYTQKVFVSTLNPSGTQLLFSTFLENGFSEGIAVNAKGDTYVTGIATSNNFPLLNAIQGVQPTGGPPFGSNSFVTELDLSGKILFSTYLGETGGGAQTAGIAVDKNEGIYVAGAGQGDFPILDPIPSEIHQTTNYTLFVAKISHANVPQFSLSPQVSPILTLRNVSSVPLTVSSITPSANFTKGGDCEKTLAPATACTLLLIGKADNKIAGTVTIASNATTRPKTVTIYKSPTGDSVSASLTINPTYVQFPPQLIGSTSAPQQVVISNTGPLPAAIDSIFVNQPSAFTEINDCPGLLEPFSYCTVTITYTAATGTDYSQLGIVHDPGQTQDTVYLSGNGSNSAIFASTSAVNFGTQFVGSKPLSRIVNFTNTSPYPAQITGLTASKGFGQINTCAVPLAPQGECRVAVWYVPATNESPTGQLTASNLGPGGPQAVSLYGTGQILSDLAVSPIPLAIYGTVGQTSSGSVTLTNSSLVAMSIGAFKVNGPFTETNNCGGSLASGATCTLTVNFAPSQAGTFNGTIAITHGGVGSPQVVPIVGNARTIFFLQPASWDYGQVPVNTSQLGYIGVTNGGNTDVTVQSITVQGSDFKLTKDGCPKVLPPNDGCADIEITFTPSAIGLRTGTATVTASDSSTPFVATLQGVGVSAGVGTLSSSSLTFSPQTVGTTSPPQTVTLTNNGTGVLTLGAISASTQFVQTKICGTTLAAGASCDISVSFAPGLVGILEGTLVLQDDGVGSPHTVTLSGIGQ